MQQYLIFGIFIYVFQKGKTTAQSIAERFEISTRTVYRYIDAISYSCIPIITKTGRYGGIFIDQNFEMKSFLFSNEEKAIIIGALQKEKTTNPCVNKILAVLN